MTTDGTQEEERAPFIPPTVRHEDITIVGTPEARSKLWQAMGKARASFDKVSKSITGQTGQQKFQYSNFAQLSGAMVEHLAAHDLAIIQMITTPSSDYSVVTTLLAGHGAELWVEIKFTPTANDHGMQATLKDFGAQTTYLKRYQLQAIGFIEGDRDADDDDARDMPSPRGGGGPDSRGRSPTPAALPAGADGRRMPLGTRPNPAPQSRAPIPAQAPASGPRPAPAPPADVAPEDRGDDPLLDSRARPAQVGAQPPWGGRTRRDDGSGIR